MTEIRNKIKELEKKLNSKIKIKVKNKTRFKRQSIHLREYYLSEIEKLKRQIGEVDSETTHTSPIKKVRKEKYFSKSNSVRLIYTPMGNKR
ncbi:hypothetical protein [Mariniflexile sp. AS56]|uniref:hypothetical protein n=1 Tax=Mariniflexile sp. AS56 TaxID=3063957 RepID=UPI0026EA187E|nr:hypothetical protein [Mariniflexile sp. AS56]MDO7173089.1 hypothetical protein [Mariniflexile sp. AS56]